ncbi:hypothetical protein PIB30_051191 [Stylosanthes scabra]|uniref:Uncharacterized protein n=1 Tax=Stylosanthes scabra TaxID=79078 RepID=A0ABU6WIW3_9FABA|nr:hypothetical protein [Stylosanthes scabra]
MAYLLPPSDITAARRGTSLVSHHERQRCSHPWTCTAKPQSLETSVCHSRCSLIEVLTFGGEDSLRTFHGRRNSNVWMIPWPPYFLRSFQSLDPKVEKSSNQLLTSFDIAIKG